MQRENGLSGNAVRDKLIDLKTLGGRERMERF